MNITFLGTGAADFSPLLKTEYRNRLGKDVRRSSSVLIDGWLLIDCGPHVCDSLRIQGIDPSCITDLLVTHFHGDHFAPERAAELAAGTKAPLRIWYHAGASPEPIPHAELHPLPVGQTAGVGRAAVKPLAANHSAWPLHYDIELPDGRLFYGCDGAWLLTDTWYAMRGRQYDLMILDGTVGDYAGDYRMCEHNSIPMVRLMLASFRTQGVVAPDGAIYLSHIAPTLHVPHEQLAACLQADGLIAAYDGLTAERKK